MKIGLRTVEIPIISHHLESKVTMWNVPFNVLNNSQCVLKNILKQKGLNVNVVLS